jgi:hypothetical protein
MILESQNEKETGDWIRLHNEKCHNFYSSTYNTKNDQTKDRMGCAGHVIFEMHTKLQLEPTQRALGDLGTDGPPGQLMWKAFKMVDRVQGRALVNS